ncbi:transposase-like zinc-binding domain-containing protein [Brevibacterium renqingii]|uniref:transposase-like zinc-binding domain-containing protein n=1 Tax=Brevibacterium renqingii TaxID=2776916 RepID=UPI003CCD1233
MPNPRNHPICGVCANKLVKNGKTSAGRTRWRCKHCGSSAIQTRTDSAKKADFTSFIAWLTSTQPRGDFATSTRTFTRKIQWCWTVTPGWLRQAKSMTRSCSTAPTSTAGAC